MDEQQKDEQLPIKSEAAAEEERTWRDVAQRWKDVGKQMVDLGERLGVAFKEGWGTDEMTEEEEKRLRDRLRKIGERMDKAVDRVRVEAKEPDTKAAARETWDATRDASSQLMSEVQDSLSEGLKEINKRIDDMSKKRKAKQEGEGQ
ncbi:MAG: hypothetical protein GWN99_04665 [Gemmatimonadetes bacterium]|uniref:Uncharacterized protein n=1 Tax=Candidatus Kutchimonas denitrificans TaxID=3056748 RepID=A0AAE4Z8R4_9BACT|nr:hypothetical protein [Gemmatimonadota bacterium]NIR75743.1 hypothetical protein [Candidatus Kutchimonas denitrificans]NIS00356.1 hypothetical protein [Gemmatimonadota bacterium]NIT66015.1 hypothetical protein [Gemmatimonadota bacterium]NIU53719.1 hypothetical protein [Gemmatimonadota bacterium]